MRQTHQGFLAANLQMLPLLKAAGLEKQARYLVAAGLASIAPAGAGCVGCVF